MAEVHIYTLLHKTSYFSLCALNLGYFLLLYFGLAPLFAFVCKKLEARSLLHKIEKQEVTKQQIAFELKHSFVSIVVFGLSIVPVVYLVRTKTVTLLPDTWVNIIVGLVLLTLWNELHFYVVHRFMHQKFMMKHIHFVHHKSRIPTVYSVYSFHWVEALLLSTVPLTILPFVPFSILAVAAYPVVSILLNLAGHCNYRFGSGHGHTWLLFGTRHNEHHTKGRRSFGFVLSIFDEISQHFTRKK